MPDKEGPMSWFRTLMMLRIKPDWYLNILRRKRNQMPKYSSKSSMWREIYFDGSNGWRLGNKLTDAKSHLINEYEHTEEEADTLIKISGGIIQCDEEGMALLILC